MTDPDVLVDLKVRLPSRLRQQAHQDAAALNMSTTAYIELLIDRAAAGSGSSLNSLPLAESA